MIDEPSVALANGLLGWLQQTSPEGVVLAGLYQPSGSWADGGCGWLWLEPLDDGAAKAENLSDVIAELGLVVEPVAGMHGKRGTRVSGQELLCVVSQVLQWGRLEWLSPELCLLARCARLAFEVVRRRDVLTFAAPADEPWEQVLQVLYQLSMPETQEWVAWTAPTQPFRAAWLPRWMLPDLRALRQVYIGQAQGLCMWADAGRNGARTGAAGPSRLEEALDSWVCTAADWWARQTVTDCRPTAEESPKSSYHVPYRGERDMLESWAGALGAEVDAATFQADAWLIWRTLRQELQGSGWRADWLGDRSGQAYYHMDLELRPPQAGSVTGDWLMVYHVAHRYFPTSAPLSDWWRTAQRTWRIGNDILVRPDTWILPAMLRVANLFPPARVAMAQPGAGTCAIPADSVFEFITTVLPQLQAEGFTARLPEIDEEPLGNIRIRVQVQRSPVKSRPAHSGPRGAGLFEADQLVTFDWTVVVGDETITRATFEAMVEQSAPYVQLSGSWRLLPVQAILDQVRLLGTPGKSGVNILQISRAMLMSDAPQDYPAVRLEIANEDEADLDMRRTLDVLSQVHQPVLLPVPEGFQGALRHYQHVGYSWLVHLRSIGCGGCLADDMGLGKTIQVIAYLLRLTEAKECVGPHLLLCPTSLLQNWRAELARFAPGLRVHLHHGADRNAMTGDPEIPRAEMTAGSHLVITTYGTVVRDLAAFQAVAWDVVIADEAQNIKNHETKQAQAVRSLPAQHRVALTGTPVENRLEELWSIFQFVNPGYLGSLAWFRRVFAQPIAAHPDAPAARQLHRLLQPVLLRRRKNEPEIQVELPEKWEVNEYAGLTSEQAALYQSVLNRLFGEMEALQKRAQTAAISRRGHILSALIRLKQVCDHPCLLVGGTGDVGRSGKLKLLMDLLDDVMVDGEAALVFTQFRDMGELLCDVAEQRFGCRPGFLHGGLSAAARGQMVQAYQSGADPSPLLVLSLKAGGVGLNLTRANHVFHFDRWWNPAVEDQATDRAFRIGQTKDVQVHRIICSGTLEERIDTLIQAKRAVSAAVVGESEGWVTELDDEALKQLFALDADVHFDVEEIG